MANPEGDGGARHAAEGTDRRLAAVVHREDDLLTPGNFVSIDTTCATIES